MGTITLTKLELQSMLNQAAEYGARKALSEKSLVTTSFETEMVTVKEAAKLLNKSVPYIWKLINKDILPAYKENDMVTKVSRVSLKSL